MYPTTLNLIGIKSSPIAPLTGLPPNVLDICLKKIQSKLIVCRREVDRFIGRKGKTKHDDKGCTSTSIYEYAKEEIYGDEINYILIPEGTKVLYVEGLTREPRDYEVLFPPGIHLDLVENVGSKKKIWIKS